MKLNVIEFNRMINCTKIKTIRFAVVATFWSYFVRPERAYCYALVVGVMVFKFQNGHQIVRLNVVFCLGRREI